MRETAFGYHPELPEEIREIFLWLCQEVVSLNWKWNLYSKLYGNKENTDLLSELAQSTFQLFEECLRADVMMTICRLSDPAGDSHGKENISFSALKVKVDKSKIDLKKLSELRKLCDPIRKIRDKVVAHNDLQIKIKPRMSPLPGISRSQLNQIVLLCGDLLNGILQKYKDAEMLFDELAQRGGADSLIFWLSKAKEYENHRRANRRKP